MLGLMQNWPLTVDKILDHAKAWHGDREVVHAHPGERTSECRRFGGAVGQAGGFRGGRHEARSVAGLPRRS